MRFHRLLAGLLFGLAAVGAQAAPPTAPPSLIPLPVHVQAMPGAFAVRADTRVVAAGDIDSQRAEKFLIAQLRHARGMQLVPASPAGVAADGSIVLSLDPQSSIAAEGYTLDVTAHGVRIVARDGAGLFHGTVTLWQLFTSDDAPSALPAIHIDDAPRFVWRGLMLDSARHFQTAAEVRTLIDQMALHKLNVLHWHLTDDQGWRIQIKRYPELTRIGAWRTPPDAGHDGEPPRYGGFYTQEQIRAMVRYAADRYITIVPEIDLPGHAQAAVVSYPQLGVTGTRPPVSIDWGVHTTLYNPDPATIRFMEQVLDEVMALFPSRYIHLGGDEAVKDQWQASPAVQAQIKRLGLKNEDALQSWMLGQLGGYLQQHGRCMLGWDEILQGGVPADATVMSWNGIQGAIVAARKGHDVVLSPSPDLYFDQLQSARDDEGTGRVPVESLAAIYAFEPVPKELDADEAKHVLGAQANVWTEHMPDLRHIEHAVFPRLAALAEATWTPAAQHSWPGFLARLPAQLRRYSQAGIAWADSAFAADVQFDRAQALASGKASIALSNQAQFGTLHYTLDGSAPTARSPRYAQPFGAQLPLTLRTIAYAPDGTALAAARSQRIDSASLFSRNGSQLINCPGSAFRLRTQPLPDATTWMPVYEVPLFDSCQIYAAAPLDGVTGLRVELARLPRNYSLAHEQKLVVSHAASTRHGELLVRRDDCHGELLATLPLPDPASTSRRFTLAHTLPAGQGAHDLCLIFTAPIDGPIYAFGRVSLQRAAGTP
jgi:hexosaminidase